MSVSKSVIECLSSFQLYYISGKVEKGNVGGFIVFKDLEAIYFSMGKDGQNKVT